MPVQKLGFILFIIALMKAPVVSAEDYSQPQKCDEIAAHLKTEIAKARSCTSVGDCKIVWLGCPFGCGTALRKSEEVRIKGAVDSFNTTCQPCDYRCSTQKQVANCVDGLCAVTTAPIGD